MAGGFLEISLHDKNPHTFGSLRRTPIHCMGTNEFIVQYIFVVILIKNTSDRSVCPREQSDVTKTHTCTLVSRTITKYVSDTKHNNLLCFFLERSDIVS